MISTNERKEGLRKFFQSYLKLKIGIAHPEQLSKKTKFASTDHFTSTWELEVQKILLQSNIEFESKFRKFPLYSDGDYLDEYVPDFLLRYHEYEGNRILIEAHENLTGDDVMIHQIFMEQYGDKYYLIVIVPDDKLERWITANKTRALYHEIMSLEDLDEFISELKNSKEYKRRRKGKTIIISNNLENQAGQMKEISCLNCNNTFKTSNKEQLYCFSCLQKF